MQQSCQIYLNTKDSVTPDGTFFRWNLSSNVIRGKRNYQLALKSVQFPNAVYPINAYNNKLYVTLSGVTDVATITPGIYSGLTLVAHLKTILDALAYAATFTVTYNTAQQNITITPSAGNFAIRIGTTTDTAAYILGVSSAQAGTEVAAFTTANPLNIGGTVFVDVLSNVGVNHVSSSFSSRVLCRIPIDVDFGVNVFWEPQQPIVMSLTSSDFDVFEIALRDDRANPYVLPVDGCKVSLMFELSYQ